MRRMLLGLVGAVVACGAGAAKPPVSEGREMDPVVREFQLGEPPATETRGDVFGWALVVALHEAVIHHFTMPLGTAQANEAR